MADTATAMAEDLLALHNSAKAALPGLVSLREQAIASFGENGIPSSKREAWRYTKLSAIAGAGFGAGFDVAVPVALSMADVEAHFVPGAIRLAFVNGVFAADLSALGHAPGGLYASDLAGALSRGESEIEDALAALDTRRPDDALVALNTAFTGDGAVLVAKAGVTVATPIQILHYGAGPGMAHPRHLIAAEDGAEITVLETYVGREGAPYWTNAVTQIVAGEGARVRWIKHQREAANAYHISACRVHLAKDSHFEGCVLATGGSVGRDDITVELAGEGAHCALSGVMLGRDSQNLTTLTVMDHQAPGATSEQLIKSVLDDSAQGSFQGKVIVRADAQKTVAHQTNHNLLLARGAAANTKPELEILADDVVCSHGATVGELNAEALFYLRARGLDEPTAKRLLIEGFIAEVFERIDDDIIRDLILAEASIWLRSGPGSGPGSGEAA